MQHWSSSTFLDHPAHSAHAHPGIKPLEDRLYVVTCLFNPKRFLSRYKNYHAFQKQCLDAGAVLYTTEVAFGNRQFEVTTPHDPQHLQFRSQHELWYKENLINLTMQRLPVDWRYVAWIDADVMFQRPDWAQETMHLLQHYQVIQMFSHAQDLSPAYEPLTGGGSLENWGAIHLSPSFAAEYLRHGPGEEPRLRFLEMTGGVGRYYPPYGMRKGIPYAHPGFAWAARREAIDHLGGLIDWAILGSGDWHMATALVGQAQCSLAAGYSQGYRDAVLEWQYRAEKHIRRNIGCMLGLMTHLWHGKKRDRMYDTRWKFFVKTQFDPAKDLKRDSQGLWQLVDRGDPRSILLRDGLREYARVRKEDSIDV